MKPLVLLFGIATLLLFNGCEDFGRVKTAKYEVTCNPRGFFITYFNGSGNIEQKDIALGTWSYSFTPESGDFLSISAQADNENATITAKIIYDGRIIESATSSGDYVIASASGSIP